MIPRHTLEVEMRGTVATAAPIRVRRAQTETRPRCSPPRRAAPTRGYTLLELLIVGALVSVLMAGVWSLLRNWSRLYERGEQRVQHMQLMRSLCDQFTDDVHAAVQVAPARIDRTMPVPPPAAPGVSNVVAVPENAALAGGTDWLMLEIVQPANPWQGRDLDEPRALAVSHSPKSSATVLAPELRRIVYTFAPPESDSMDSLSPSVAELAAADDTELVVGEQDEAPPASGLLRLAVAQEMPLLASSAATSARGVSGVSGGSRDEAFRLREFVVGSGETDSWSGGSDFSSAESSLSSSLGNGATASATSSTHAGFETDRDGDTLVGILERDEVPEVVWFELRYFDGAGWQSSWNSQAQGCLPVAVELRFELKVATPEKKVRSTADGETETVPGASSASENTVPVPTDEAGTTRASDEDAGAVDGSSEETPYYRCVVFLEAQAKK